MNTISKDNAIRVINYIKDITKPYNKHLNKLVLCVITAIVGFCFFENEDIAGNNVKNMSNSFISTIATENNIDELLVHSIIWVESQYNPDAISPKGAIGLMQIMPANVAFCGLEVKQLNQPELNVACGVKIYAHAYEYWKKKENAIELALREYYAGRKNVNLKSAKKYSQQVLSYYNFVKKLYHIENNANDKIAF